LKNAGVPTHFITEILGHTNVQTTENYLDGFEDGQKKEFERPAHVQDAKSNPPRYTLVFVIGVWYKAMMLLCF
jgi:hypothetical protein